MANGGTATESLWRDLIADEVENWLEDNEAFEDADLLEFIRTGN